MADLYFIDLGDNDVVRVDEIVRFREGRPGSLMQGFAEPIETDLTFTELIDLINRALEQM